jgi:hypothetical protein
MKEQKRKERQKYEDSCKEEEEEDASSYPTRTQYEERGLRTVAAQIHTQ